MTRLVRLHGDGQHAWPRAAGGGDDAPALVEASWRRPTVKWTRYSLVYLASYLALTGAAFLAMPGRALELLLASGTYDHAFVRFVGAFMIALATIVVQIIRHRLEVLYPTTLAVRAMFLAVVGWLYVDTRDSLFIAIWGVIAVGVILTLAGYVLERKGSHD